MQSNQGQTPLFTFSPFFCFFLTFFFLIFFLLLSKELANAKQTKLIFQLFSNDYNKQERDLYYINTRTQIPSPSDQPPKTCQCALLTRNQHLLKEVNRSLVLALQVRYVFGQRL